MTKAYRFLRGVVKETLHKDKTNSMSLRLKASDAASFNEAMEELEKILVGRFGKLKAAVTDGQAVVADEAKHAEQEIESLRANVAVLEAKLTETEDTVRRKDVESQRMQEILNITIGDLETAVNQKEEALERRRSEVNDLTCKVDVLEKQVIDLELAIEQANDQAASEAQRAEDTTESSKAKIATIEARFRETEQMVRRKDATIKALEESLTAKIHELESQLRKKEILLAEQIGQVTDLKFELQRLTDAMKEMPSLSAEAGALADSETGRAVVNEQLKTEEEKAATSDFRNGGVTSNVKDADRQTVSLEVFDRMIDELFEFTDVERPIASLIVLHHVECLGESMEAFPQTRLTELLEALSGEISDDKLRTAFCQHLGRR